MKRLICLFLILSLVMSVNVVFANESTDEKDYSYEKSLIDIISGNFSFSSEEVIRSDFLSLLMSLTGADYKGATGESLYSDVDANSELSGILLAAQQRKILSKGAKFYPNEPVTYAQAVKMAVVLAGYYELAEAKGGYPTGYLTQASSVNLLKNIQIPSNEAPISMADTYILLYNTVNAEMMVQTSYGEETGYKVVDGVTILSEYHNIYEFEGIVTADSRTSLYSTEKAVAEGRIEVGGEFFFTDIKDDILGYNLSLYYRDDDGEKKIVLAKPEDNSELLVVSKDFSRITGNTYEYLVDDKERTVRLSPEVNLIKNFSAYFPDSMTAFFSEPNGIYTFVDNNNDNVYDVVKAKIYTYVHVLAVDYLNGFIYDKNDSANLINLSGDCKYDIYVEYFDGIHSATLEEIETETLLACLQTPDKGYSEITVLGNISSGTVDSVDDEGITINGTRYLRNVYLDKYFNIEAGDMGTFFFGIDDTVVSFTENASGAKYGWVVGYTKTEGINESYKMKIFTQDDVMLVANIAEKLDVDGNRMTVENAHNTLSKITSKADEQRLIRFMVNKNSEISMIDTTESVTKLKDAFDRSNDLNTLKLFYHNVILQYKRSVNNFGRKIKMNGTTAIFAIPSGADAQSVDENYAILPLTHFIDDERTKPITAYDMNADNGVCGAVIRFEAASGVDPAYGSVYVVEKKLEAINTEQVPCYLLRLWKSDGKYYEYYTDENIAADAAAIEPGDIIRINTNLRNEITAVSIDYDLSADTVKSGLVQYQADYQRGYAYSFDGSTIILLQGITDISDANEIDNYDINNLFVTAAPKAVVVEMTKENGSVKSVSVKNVPTSSIKTVQNSADDADSVLVYHYNWTGNAAIIYREK